MAKKKKRGRPSIKKKIYYKPKYKGVRYITNALIKKYPKRYKSRAEASEVAKQLLSELQSTNTKVTLGKALQLLVDNRREARLSGLLYDLPKELTELKPYYEFDEYSDLIGGLEPTPKILFTSALIPTGLPPILSGNFYDYSDYFAPFVNFIDKLRAISSKDLYEQEWYIRSTVPKRVKGTNSKSEYEYVSRIIVCDINGWEVTDGYGFDPNDVDKDVVDALESDFKVVSIKASEGSSSSSDIDKQIELEKLKIERDKLNIEKAKELRALLDAKVPYEDAKKLLGLD